MSRAWGGYSAEVREEGARSAIALVMEGMSAARACEVVAGELGCHPNSVRAWARDLDPLFGRALRADQVPDELRELREQVVRLRRQVREQDYLVRRGQRRG